MRILDIDNLISHDLWRIPRIAWQFTDPARRYHDYHSLAPWDAVGNQELFIGCADGIAILTARPVAFRAATEEWLARAGVRYEHLIMRNSGDYRPSVVLKAQQLRWLLSGNYGVVEIECAYDDRADVVAMYRAAGLRAEVRALHDVCAYTDPTVPQCLD